MLAADVRHRVSTRPHCGTHAIEKNTFVFCPNDTQCAMRVNHAHISIITPYHHYNNMFLLFCSVQGAAAGGPVPDIALTPDLANVAMTEVELALHNVTTWNTRMAVTQ